jgi:hypothetical protein
LNGKWITMPENKNRSYWAVLFIYFYAVKLCLLRELFSRRSPDRTPPLLSGEMVAGCGMRSRPRGGGVWGGIRAGFGFLFSKKFGGLINSKVSRHTILTRKNGESKLYCACPAHPVRAQSPAVFRKYYKTAGLLPVIY